MYLNRTENIKIIIPYEIKTQRNEDIHHGTW